MQDHDGDPAASQVLLIPQLLVGCDQHIKLLFRFPEQFAIREFGLTCFKRGNYFVSDEMLPQRHRRSLIKENAHFDQAVARLASANSGTASACARVTPGNHSRNRSTVAPPSRFSKSVFTGTRVPRKTHAPLTFSGERSTTVHALQSSIATLKCFADSSAIRHSQRHADVLHRERLTLATPRRRNAIRESRIASFCGMNF